VLVAYFSRAGENYYYYYYGRRWLKTGNTEVLATMIAGLVPADVYRIAAADAYPDDYDATVERNVREL
jgi:flavodoxin